MLRNRSSVTLFPISWHFSNDFPSSRTPKAPGDMLGNTAGWSPTLFAHFTELENPHQPLVPWCCPPPLAQSFGHPPPSRGEGLQDWTGRGIPPPHLPTLFFTAATLRLLTHLPLPFRSGGFTSLPPWPPSRHPLPPSPWSFGCPGFPLGLDLANLLGKPSPAPRPMVLPMPLGPVLRPPPPPPRGEGLQDWTRRPKLPEGLRGDLKPTMGLLRGFIPVLDLVTQIRDVVFVNVYLGPGYPRGSGFWNEGYMRGGRETGRSVYEQPGNEVDWILLPQGGFQVSKGKRMGSKREWEKGKQKARGLLYNTL